MFEEIVGQKLKDSVQEAHLDLLNIAYKTH